MLGVATSALRYYEAEGLLPAVERSEGGRRRYSDADLGALRVVECLKRSGLSIKEIKAFMDMCVEGDTTLADRLELFRNRREVVRREIDALREVLDVLAFKPWSYEQAVAAGTEDAVRALPSARTPDQHRAAKDYLAGVPMPCPALPPRTHCALRNKACESPKSSSQGGPVSRRALPRSP